MLISNMISVYCCVVIVGPKPSGELEEQGISNAPLSLGSYIDLSFLSKIPGSAYLL